ncbi:methyltransferase [Streptomyces natalensis]|nr:methyltransferase [Streptomyces natalensis]
MNTLDEERRRLTEMFDIAPSRVLYAVSVLGVADRVPPGGSTVERIAAAVGTDAQRLGRLVRAAETLGIFRVDAAGTVRLTPAGTLLRSDQPGSLRAEFSDNALFTAWGPFAETVRGGAPSYDLANGTSIFAGMSGDPGALVTFHDHMRMRAQQLYRSLLPFLLKRCAEDVVDLAGGTGGLSELLLEGDAAVRVTLTDLPEVIALVPPDMLRRYGDRFSAEPGDMRAGIPRGYGTYLLGSVLHDWADDQAAEILRRCADGMVPGSELILLERVLAESGPDPRRMGDMWMMAMTGGRERTRQEWAELAGPAGLTLRHVHHGAGEISAVVLGRSG